MAITQRITHNATLIDIDDVFTYRNRKEFSSAVTHFRESGGRHLIVNLHEVTYMDSAAVGLLALTSQQLTADNRSISLVDPQGTVKQILEMANIDRMIAVFPSEQAAVDARAA
ncbi:MAG: STAS domain-containing protein [Nitrospira sp. BO4]|jgi:anti-anti-sigma factor|nr:STAS domain-containing protein [Nitrospira sp. BO4]